MKNLLDLEKKINSELATKIKKTELKYNQIYIETNKDDLFDVILFLKTDKYTQFRQLIDITAVDFPSRKVRFDVVYHLLSMAQNKRVRIKFRMEQFYCISNKRWSL